MVPPSTTQDCEWSVTRRYSQLLELKTRMEKETIKTTAVFPKKSMGTLSKAALEKRREQVTISSVMQFVRVDRDRDRILRAPPRYRSFGGGASSRSQRCSCSSSCCADSLPAWAWVAL